MRCLGVARPSTSTLLAEILDKKPEQVFKTRLGRFMAAELKGEGFVVEPRGKQKKDLFVSDTARWDWTVTPVRASRHKLTVSAYVVIKSPDGSDNENLIRTFHHDVVVHVPIGAKVADGMDDTIEWMGRANRWLLALAGLMSGGVLAVWLAFRKLKGDKAAD